MWNIPMRHISFRISSETKTKTKKTNKQTKKNTSVDVAFLRHTVVEKLSIIKPCTFANL